MTPKQQAFVDEYLLDLNATQAAIRAGYSAKTAEQQGPRLLGNVEVARAVKHALAERAERTQVRADEVLRELRTIYTSDVRDFNFSDAGELTLRDGALPCAWRAVASVKRRTRRVPRGEDLEPVVEHTIEYRLWDKNAAIANAMKHLGLLSEEAANGLVVQVRVRHE